MLFSRNQTRFPPILALFLLMTPLLTVAAVLFGFAPRGLSYTEPRSDDTSLVTSDLSANVSTVEAPITCVVIDAGHGGEDGGAVASSGLNEKEVNLSVALALRELLEAAGIPTVMTRTEDKLLYDRAVDFQGRKKVLDLAARRIIAEETDNCLFISIHVNSFPQAQYSGIQVWYGTEDTRSQEIAAAIQANSTQLLTDNHRRIKAAGSHIYLLDRIEAPVVLVECGFLSNPDEALRLSDEDYRRALATIIFSAILPYIEQTG